ncbi:MULTISPECIES: hypothetical protein [Streptomyces]|uniref:hypothetical protein n=1 Tax=Streptomyces TaxID=1883 RepID=UPI001E2B8A49|nr:MULTISPECIES: hypothetical protein [Streptomyces]UFQ17681.1 hypothetical protein J2N69_23260 [Streptomyces huasconensis]WCL87288.1 hypothetical protein PPN52_23265 [Streptomyces sp. JCM 35825]
MTGDETSRFVRLRVEMVVEVEDAEQLTGAALARVAEDERMPAGERAHAEAAVKEDGAEALAYLVDPFDLVSEVPGIDLTQASWSSEVIDYDPDAPDWDPDEDDDDDGESDGDDEHDAEYGHEAMYGRDDRLA